MSTRMVLISPHLDDCVLSCWRRLTTDAALVVTVFAGVPTDPSHLGSYDAFTGAHSSKARMIERLAEDTRIMKKLSVQTLRLPFLDAQYEGQREVNEVAEALQPILRDAEIVLFPAGIGGHVDHRTTRDAVLAAVGIATPKHLVAFADYPYAAYYGWPGWVTGSEVDPYLDIDARWDAELMSIRSRGWMLQPKILTLAPNEIREKIAAFETYETQFAVINAGPHELVTGPEVIPYEVEFELVRPPIPESS